MGKNNNSTWGSRVYEFKYKIQYNKEQQYEEISTAYNPSDDNLQ